jgi:hypothetical protein
MVVVCDDAKTSVAYFTLVKRAVKEKLTLTIVRNPDDRATPIDVVASAVRQKRQLTQEKVHDAKDKSVVWALIDLEQDPKRRQAGFAAKKAGEKDGVSVAISDPCYEVWTLLHLADTGEAFADCSAVITRIEREWPKQFGQAFGKKAQADYSRILQNREIAASRARRHHEAGDQSWTEVYLVIEKIAAILASDESVSPCA